VGLGVAEPFPEGTTFLESLRLMRRQGALLVLAHPQWCGNSVEAALRHGFDGVEVYNDVCRWLNGKGEGTYFWDRMLCGNADVLGFAADDAHLSAAHPTWNGGWIMVNCAELTRDALMRAIRRGEFYATTGPQILSIHTTAGHVRLATSPARTVRLASAASHTCYKLSPTESGSSEWELPMPQGWPYVRVEVEDLQGRRAWTNTLVRAS